MFCECNQTQLKLLQNLVLLIFGTFFVKSILFAIYVDIEKYMVFIMPAFTYMDL